MSFLTLPFCRSVISLFAIIHTDTSFPCERCSSSRNGYFVLRRYNKNVIFFWLKKKRKSEEDETFVDIFSQICMLMLFDLD